MKAIALIGLIAFIAIGVFSFSGLTSHESLFSQCASAVLPGMPCDSTQAHDVSMTIWHAKIFQSFSIALLVAAVVFIAAAMYVSLVSATSHVRLAYQTVNFEAATASVDNKYTYWLTLFEQHPNRA